MNNEQVSQNYKSETKILCHGLLGEFASK